MPTIHVCAVTRNKAMHATTLHTIMNIHMYCMVKGFHLEIHFLKDRANVQKFMKSGVERLIFMDYGVSIDNESVYKACEPFEKYNVLVLPSVKEGINWIQFRKETLRGSTEPVYQRGLEFDTRLIARLQILSTLLSAQRLPRGRWMSSRLTKSAVRQRVSRSSSLVRLPSFSTKWLNMGLKFVH